MNAPESSPLRALDLLYDRLATDTRYDLARPGYSAQKVSFCILLNPDGSLSAIQDERDTSGKKPLARLLTLPGQAKPPGQGLNPCFLWDNSAYLLGYKTEDEKPERTAKAFAAFRERHLALENTLGDPGFAAVCAFLRTWTPARALEHKTQLDDFAATGFGIFRLVGEHCYVHDRPAVAAYWAKTSLAADSDATRGQCLITGDADQPLAQLIEPAIKGVKDAQPGGAKIISFNCDSFISYGKDQALNSPISQSSAFRHATALNALLAGPQSRLHRVQIGDATTVFWTGAPTVTEGFLAAFLDGHTPDSESLAQDETLRARLGTFFEVLRTGGGRTLDRLTDDATTPFYVLGLSPNAARLSVRFWHAGTLGSLVDHLRDHYDALRIVRPPGPQHPEFPAAWQLLRQAGRESKDISPLLAGPFLRAVLTGAPYPPTLASAVIARIRADRDLSYLRAAILKAFLNRNHQLNMNEALDPSRPEAAYHLGRLFSIYETAQRHAHDWKLERTIRETLYSAASTTPLAVFPKLERLFHYHTREKKNPPKSPKSYADLASDVNQNFRSSPIYPRVLALADQALFAVGYYHQMHFFRSLSDRETQVAA